jgi:signal transduction histidine kinase
VRAPGAVAVYFAFFFGIAVFVSLVSHALLAFESDVRWLATMGAMLTAIYLIILGLSGVGLLFISAAIVETFGIGIVIMLLCFIATVGRTGPIWVILQIIVFLIYVITMASTSAAFRATGSDFVALFGPPWQQGLHYTAYALDGIFRFGALVQCKNMRATTVSEEIAYWILIAMHVGLYFANLALKPIILQGTASALDNAQLLNAMSALVQFALTPLLLVHFEALNHARSRNLLHSVERAEKKLAVAQSAAQARREFIRYVFHEVRVPFNTIVLGLDEIKAVATETRNKPMLSDIKLMQTAADGMQQYVPTLCCTPQRINPK